MKKVLILLMTVFGANIAYLSAQNAQIVGLDPSNVENGKPVYCRFAAGDTLSGVPAGGTFVGAGMDGNVFYPNGAGVGVHGLKYTVTVWDSLAQQSIDLVASVELTVSDTIHGKIYSDYSDEAPSVICASADSFGLFAYYDGSDVQFTESPGFEPTIFGNSPSVYGVTVHPELLSSGESYTITGTGSTLEGCAFVATTTLTVAPLPPVSVGLSSNYCITTGGVLANAVPAGGVLSGPGAIPGNVFNTFVAGAGTHTLVYQGNYGGCPYADSLSVTVGLAPQAQILNLPAQMCVTDAAITLEGYPTPGVWTGPAITGNIFVPSAMWLGSAIISYSGTYEGCTFLSAQTIVITQGYEVYNQTQAASCPTCADGWVQVYIGGGATPPFQVSLDGGQNYITFETNLDTITGLLPSNYNAVIQNAGGGCATNFSFTIEGGVAVCAAPAGLTLTKIQPGSVLVQWQTVPTAVNYTLRYRKVGAPTWLSLVVTGNYRTLTNLSATSIYEWRVRANCINIGAGPFSDGQNFTPDGGVPPCEKPTGLTVIETGAIFATLSWNAQTGAQFELQYRRTAGGPWLTKTTDAASITLTGLLPSTLYTVRLRATCGNGYQTQWSPLVNFATQAPLPIQCLAPTDLSVDSVGATNATVNWAATPNAIGYELILFKGNEQINTFNISVVPTFLLNDLEPNTAYTVRLRANCETGQNSVFITAEFQTLAGKLSGDLAVSGLSEVVLYPNPNKGRFTLNFSATESQTVPLKLYDMTGKTVYEDKYSVTQGENEIFIETNLPAGLYVLHCAEKTVKVRID